MSTILAQLTRAPSLRRLSGNSLNFEGRHLRRLIDVTQRLM